MSLYFEGNVMAHLHVNWLSPVKVRQTLIGGDKKMLVWNDLENEEKIRIYDKGVDFLPLEDGYQALGQYRIGDMYSPPRWRPGRPWPRRSTTSWTAWSGEKAP